MGVFGGERQCDVWVCLGEREGGISNTVLYLWDYTLILFELVRLLCTGKKKKKVFIWNCIAINFVVL